MLGVKSARPRTFAPLPSVGEGKSDRAVTFELAGAFGVGDGGYEVAGGLHALGGRAVAAGEVLFDPRLELPLCEFAFCFEEDEAVEDAAGGGVVFVEVGGAVEGFAGLGELGHVHVGQGDGGGGDRRGESGDRREGGELCGGRDGVVIFSVATVGFEAARGEAARAAAGAGMELFRRFHGYWVLRLR